MRLLQSNRARRRKNLSAWLRLFNRPTQNAALSTFLFCVSVLAMGCQSSHESNKPLILFTRIPPAETGGPEVLDQINGRVVNGKPGARIVVYSLSRGTWWVQPFRSHPFTEIGSDGSWRNDAHLGSNYAALLVAPGYQPAAKLPALPQVNGALLAVGTIKGSSEHLADPKMLHFSGYDWKIRSYITPHGEDTCLYDPSNVWVDDRGYLHLLMLEIEGRWHCAGISLTRSLGYGTYRFMVSDSAHLPPSVVLAMFTCADNQDVEDRRDLKIELSQWGKADHGNANFVVQPYYVPNNTVYFSVPAGPMTYVLRWEPGTAFFKAFKGVSAAPPGDVMDHVFKSGIPEPSTETIHLDFYDFRHSQSGLQHPVEIVVQKFEYLP